MPRFTRAELESYRDAEVPDLAGPGMRLLFVGINPGLMTAATGIHFGNPGNRFRPALVAARLLAPLDGAPPGMTEADLAALVARGVGITNLVRRATARADELTKAELVEGGARLEAFVAAHRPRVVAVLGVTAYRSAFALPKATLGRQPDRSVRRRAVGGAQPERAERPRDDRLPRPGVRRDRHGQRASSSSAPVERVGA